MRQTDMTSRRRAVDRLAVPILLGWLVGVGGCDIAAGTYAGRASDEWKRSYELASGEFELVNVNGAIRAEASDGSTLDIRAERTARARTDEAARDLLRRLEIREQASSGRVKIETRPPSGSFLSGGTSVTYTVRVPKGLKVALRTTNGELTLTGVAGDVKVETVNGQIKVSDVGGSVEGSTVNGGIEVDVARLAQAGVRLETTNGGIVVRLPADAAADLRARVTNGGIDVSGLELERQGEQSRRRVEGRLNGGGPIVSLETTNGGIDVTKR